MSFSNLSAAFLYLVIVLCFYVTSCSKSDNSSSGSTHQAPTILSVSADSGSYKDIVIIAGANFSTSIGGNIVKFNDSLAVVLSASPDTLLVQVPLAAGTGPITISVNGASATGPIFNYIYSATVTTFAGGVNGFADGFGTTAQFDGPYAITIDQNDNLYVADANDNHIRKITPSAMVTTLAGNSLVNQFSDGTGVNASFYGPEGIAIDSNQNLYIADQGNRRIRKISPALAVTTVAGNGIEGHIDGSGSMAEFEVLSGIWSDPQGVLVIADGSLIRKIDQNGAVTTLAGVGVGFVDGPSAEAKFSLVYDVKEDANGDLYVADFANNRIRKISKNGIVSTFAGSGLQSYSDGVGLNASFYYPAALCFDHLGNLLVSDAINDRIRKITPAGVVSTIAGDGVLGYKEGNAMECEFRYPVGLCVNKRGDIFVCDFKNDAIRKITFQ